MNLLNFPLNKSVAIPRKNLFEKLPRLLRRNILVFGDVSVDTYHECDVSQVACESGLPILWPRLTKMVSGMSGNVARNLQALQASPTLIGSKYPFDQNKTYPHYSISEKVCSKHRYVHGNNHLGRIDYDETAVPDVKKLANYAGYFTNQDVLIVSDYGKGIVTPESLGLVRRMAREKGLPVVGHPKPSRTRMTNEWLAAWRGMSRIVLNAEEIVECMGAETEKDLACPQTGGPLAPAVVNYLQQIFDCDEMICTLGLNGVMAGGRGIEPFLISTEPVQNANTCGVRDTFLALMGLTHGVFSSLESIQLAQVASRIVLKKPGTETVLYDELVYELSFL